MQMFNIFKRKSSEYFLSRDEKDKFRDSLTAISQNLFSNKFYQHQKVIDRILQFLEKDSIAEFKVALNEVDMWGGAGSVWEICIENKDERIVFQEKIIRLINLMEESKIMGSKSKSVRKIFQNEIATL